MKNLPLLYETLEKVIEQRDYLMNLTKIYTKKIMFLESEVTKLMEISVADDIVMEELSRIKNIYKKEMQSLETEFQMSHKEYQRHELDRTEGGHVIDWDSFDEFANTLSQEDKKIWNAKFIKCKSYREIILIPSVKIKSISTIAARLKKLTLEYVKFLNDRTPK